MKTYIYTYRRGRQDPNGNPRHWVTVFRVKNNVPIQLGKEEDVGYRTERLAVEVVIAREEKWGRGRISPAVCNRVRMARQLGHIQIIQI